MHNPTLYWILISLITSLIVIRAEETENFNIISDWDFIDWFGWVLVSIVFPAGLIIILVNYWSKLWTFLVNIKNVFTKKRKFGNEWLVKLLQVIVVILGLLFICLL